MQWSATRGGPSGQTPRPNWAAQPGAVKRTRGTFGTAGACALVRMLARACSQTGVSGQRVIKQWSGRVVKQRPKCSHLPHTVALHDHLVHAEAPHRDAVDHRVTLRTQSVGWAWCVESAHLGARARLASPGTSVGGAEHVRAWGRARWTLNGADQPAPALPDTVDTGSALLDGRRRCWR